MQIKTVKLIAPDLTLVEAFYSGVMGFQVARTTDHLIEFHIGKSLLCFTLGEVPAVYHFAFSIAFNQLDAAIKWLSDRVSMIQFHEKDVIDFPNWNAKSVYFLDNTGNVLEFIARGSELAPEPQFNSDSITSVCEIALVTDDVPALVERLMEKFGLHYYQKQPPRRDFSVLGDDDGLLILVGSTRKWFPTDYPAKKFPVVASVEADGKDFKISYNI